MTVMRVLRSRRVALYVAVFAMMGILGIPFAFALAFTLLGR